MSTRSASTRSAGTGSKSRVALVVFLFVAAIGAWVGIWRWQSQQTPPLVERHLEEGARLFQAGQMPQAESEWLKAVELDPKNAATWEVLGDFYLATKQWNPALKSYAVVAKLQPESAHLPTKMARAETNTGNAGAARRHVEEALKRDPNDIEALNIQTTLLKRAGEDSRRAEVLLRLVKLKPDDALLLNKTADALMIQRRHTDAAPLVEKLLTLDPNSSSAYAMRGAIAFSRDASPASLQKAVADFKKAISLNDTHWVARWYLGRSYLRLNQPEPAVKELKIVDAIDPADKNYLNDLATAYQQSGQANLAAATRKRYAVAERQNHAITELRSRVAAAPEDFDANLQLGVLLLKSKNPDGAEDLLQKALKLKPQNAAALKAVRDLNADYLQQLKRGLQLLEAKKPAPAAPCIARALQLRPYDERTISGVQQLADASGINFYQTVFELERLAQR